MVVLEIRAAKESDRDAIWNIFHAVVAAGDTYAFDPKMSRQDALAYWFRGDTHTYVAENDGRAVGTYILKPNQADPVRMSRTLPSWSRQKRAVLGWDEKWAIIA